MRNDGRWLLAAGVEMRRRQRVGKERQTFSTTDVPCLHNFFLFGRFSFVFLSIPSIHPSAFRPFHFIHSFIPTTLSHLSLYFHSFYRRYLFHAACYYFDWGPVCNAVFSFVCQLDFGWRRSTIYMGICSIKWDAITSLVVVAFKATYIHFMSYIHTIAKKNEEKRKEKNSFHKYRKSHFNFAHFLCHRLSVWMYDCIWLWYYYLYHST